MQNRLPSHVGFIPDGNRRWAVAHGGNKSEGYCHGIDPGLRLLRLCIDKGIAEVSIYGYTKENVHRSAEQVSAFKNACVEYAKHAIAMGAALRVIGDANSRGFPDELKPHARERTGGTIRVNLIVNYGWQWDLLSGSRTDAGPPLASAGIPEIDLVVRWGGRRRLSGFLPFQSAYADIYVLDTLWPDMQTEEFEQALKWYQAQDVTKGG